MSILECLKQYDYIFAAQLEDYHTNFEINYIWQCWLQGEHNAPELVKTCLQSVQKYQPEFKIKLLHEDNVQDFITIPQFILEKYRKGLITPAHFSDYIRVALLTKYGGTWLDATVFLTDKIPENIFKQDFFAPKFPPWCKLPTLPSIANTFSTSVRKMDKLCFSNWLMHAKCNSRLLKIIKLFLEEYWAKENVAFDYFMFHLFSTYVILKDAKCKDIFRNMLELSNAYAHLLQQCLLREYDAELFNKIQKTSSIHKLIHSLDGEIAQNSFASYLIQSADLNT